MNHTKCNSQNLKTNNSNNHCSIVSNNEVITNEISQTLISFVKVLIDQEQDKAVLLDIYNNPIEVELQTFLEEIISRYFEATNEYHAEYQKLRKSRKVHKLIDLDIDDK